jgi:regulator of sigma D
MLEGCKNAKERWGGVHELIDRWLNERQELLVQFCSIEGLDEFQTKPATTIEKVQTFCNILVDYVSAGHFEIYQQLIREAQEFDDGGMELYEKLYPTIESTTRTALDFHDKYETEELARENRSSLATDLSNLGEALESRFELEDQLIEGLHEVHREKVA